jgi:4-amino-4-deoxy-L-arabinose transferase-like glycosyltransferase
MSKNKDNINKNTQNKNYVHKFIFLSKEELKIIVPVFITGLLLRLLYIFEISGTPFVEHLMSDSKIYHDWAMDIVRNSNWIGDEVFFMAPAYPYFLGFVYLIFGSSILSVQILQAVISSFNIVIVYFIGRNLHSNTVGFISSAISALFLNFIFYSGTILSETIQIFFISLLILALSVNVNKLNYKNWFLIGLLIGISAIFRANILLFVVFVFIWFLVNYLKQSKLRKVLVKAVLFLCLGTLLPILPITVRNLAIGNDLVLLTSNGGINLYIGNYEKASSVFVTPTEFDFYEDLSGRKYAERKVGVKMTPSEASSYWYDKGLNYILKHPGETIVRDFERLILFFGESENPQSTIMDPDYFSREYSTILQLPLFSFLFVSLFSIVGLQLYWKNENRNILFYLFIVSYVVGTIIFFVNGRFRLAITPILIVFASFALYKLFVIIKDKKYHHLKIPFVLVISFLIIYYFIISRPQFTEYDAYLHLGDVAYEKQEFEKAIENYNRSLFFKDYYLTYVNLGNAYAMKKDYRSAIAAFNRALNRKPDYLLAHFNLGFAYTQQENPQLGMILIQS